MPWHIISIGDEAYLFKIFQFLSMLNSPGTSLYGTLGMLGALIGLMMLLFQAVSSAGRDFSFGSLIIGIVMFTVLFGTSTNVELEDFHTGRTDIVNGVPLGTAIVGTLVSEGGAELINRFQQGTAVPGQEVMPSDYALRALAATYTLAALPGCGNNAALCPLTKTLQRYWSDCVYPQNAGLGTGTQGWANGDPTTSKDALAAIKSSNAFTVTTDYVHDGSGSPSPQTCADTYTDIARTFSSTAGSDAIACQYLAAAGQSVQGGATPGTCTTQAEALLHNSFNGLKGGADGSAGQSELALGSAIQDAEGSNLLALQNLVIASAAHGALASGGKGTANDLANASMVESAAQRRDITYAAEQSMFGRTLNATIAFFEGIIYGLAPFMAFLVPLGAIGVKYLGQYLKLLVWLFLWLPLLSFVNLYEIMATMRTMNALQPTLNGAPLYSMVGIMQVQNAAADWIALGGWFTTSIIGLSGMIVFGSVAAFQSIAQAAHGPDAVNPATVAPELATSAPAIQRGADYTSSGGASLSMSGMQSEMFTNQGAFSAAHAYMGQDIVNKARALGFNGSIAQGSSVQDVANWMATVRAGKSHTVDTQEGALNTAGSAVGATNVVDDKGSMSLRGNASISTPGALKAAAGLSASIGVDGAKTWAVGDNTTRQQSQDFRAPNGITHDDAVTGGEDASRATGGSRSFSSTNQQSMNSAFNDLAGEVRQYQTQEQVAATSSATVSVSANNVASAFTSSEAGRAQLATLDGVVNDLGSGARGYQNQLAEQLVERGVYSTEQAHAVATMATLQKFSSSEVDAESRMMAVDALSKGLDFVSPTYGSVSSINSAGIVGAGDAVASVTSAGHDAAARVDRNLAGGHFIEHPGAVGNSALAGQSRAVEATTQSAEFNDQASGTTQAVDFLNYSPVVKAGAEQAERDLHRESAAMTNITGTIDAVTNINPPGKPYTPEQLKQLDKGQVPLMPSKL